MAGTRWRLPFVAALAIIALCLAPIAAGAKPDPLTSPGRGVTAAVPGNFPPQYILGKDGKPTGFAIDVLNRIARSAGLEVKYLVLPDWSKVLEAVRNGQADLIPNVGITAERASILTYTSPVETFPISIFVRRGTSNIGGLESLAGRKVGFVTANVAGRFLRQREHRLDLKLVEFEEVETALIHLLAGQVDAIAYPQPVLNRLAEQAGLENNIKVVGEPLFEIKRAMAVRKGDAALAALLDQAVSRFVATEEFREIYRKWHEEPRPFWTVALVAWTMGILVAGTAILLVGWRFRTVVRFNRQLGEQIAKRDRLQGELVASESRLRDLIEGSIQGLFVIRDHKVRFANTAYARIHGYETAKEILALDTIEGHYAPSDYRRILAYQEARLRGDPTPVEYEYEGRTKDGEVIWLQSHNRRIDWDGGPAVQVTLFNITQRKRAEEERQRLATAIEQAADGILITDAEGRIEYVNPAYERMTGYSRDEAIGHKPSISKSGRHDDAFYRGMWESIARGDVWAGQVTNRRKDGALYTVELSISPMHDSTNAIVGYIGVKQDISARTRAEARFAAIIANSLDLIVVLDEETRFQLVSPSVTAQLGYVPEDLLGQPVFAMMHPDDVAPTQQALGSVLEAPGSVGAAEFRLRHQDGSWRDFDAVGTNLLNDPSIGGVLGTLRDVTERKQAMDNLARSEANQRTLEQRARLLVDSMPHALLIANSEGRITDVNSNTADWFGYSKEALIGQPVEMLIPGHLRDGHVGLRTAYAQDPEVKTRAMGKAGELYGLRRDGSEIPLDITLSPIRTEDGLEIICAMEDATERRYLQAQLITSQKMETVGRLAGGVAHDFNNMLAVILSYGEFLLDDCPQDDPKRGDIQEIISAANRSASLTRQLLAFSRQQLLQLEEIDLNVVVAGMEKMVQRLIGEDVILTTRLAPGIGSTKADVGQMEQVLMNLAVNARDAMPQGGELSIETGDVELDQEYANGHAAVQPGSYVMLSVSDTGTGMDEATRTQIFEPFFTTKEMGKGTGLGLSTVYGIVKQLGGSIWVYSEIEHGTTFKIYLPRTEGDEAMDTAPHSKPEAMQGSETILLVEDEQQVGNAARRILESAGYAVLSAASGPEAIELVENHGDGIGLVLTDVVMPKMSGADLVSHLAPLLPGVQVLYMSGYTDGALSQHNILGEGVRVLSKPFSRVSLLEQVRQALDTH